MKRVISAFLVAVLLMAGCVNVYAEEDSSENTFEHYLDTLIQLYYVAPEDFTANYIICTYNTFRAMCHYHRLQAGIAMISIEDESGSSELGDVMKSIELGEFGTGLELDDTYLQWLNDEKDDETYAKELIEFVENYLNSSVTDDE